MKVLALLLLAVAIAGCGTHAAVSPSVPLEQLSTGSAVHAAVQLERVEAAERAIEAGMPAQALMVLRVIAETERRHEAEQAAANAAARAERETAAARIAALEDELQSGTRRWWNLIAVAGGAMFVLGAVGAIFLAGVRREAVMLAVAGLLATGFAIGVLSVLPWMRWIAIGSLALGAVVAIFLVLQLIRIGRDLVATNDAAKARLPEPARDEIFSGEEPVADLIQSPPTQAFVRSVRSSIHRGERRPSRRLHTPAAPGSTPGPATRSSSLEIQS